MRLSLLNEGLSDKAQLLAKKYNIDSDKVVDISLLDPTPNFTYLDWLVKQVVKVKSIRSYEDTRRTHNVLKHFDRYKQKYPEQDIHKYKTFNDLEAQYDDLQDVKSKNELTNDVKSAGTKVLADQPDYKAIQLLTPEAAEAYAKGTKWCTSDPGVAKSYLNTGTLIVILPSSSLKSKLGAQRIQMHIPVGDDEIQIMDELDRDMLSRQRQPIRQFLTDLFAHLPLEIAVNFFDGYYADHLNITMPDALFQNKEFMQMPVRKILAIIRRKYYASDDVDLSIKNFPGLREKALRELEELDQQVEQQGDYVSPWQEAQALARATLWYSTKVNQAERWPEFDKYWRKYSVQYQ